MSVSTEGTGAPRRSHRFGRILGAVLLIGAVVLPVAGSATTAVAAGCDITCSSTLTASASPASVGSSIDVKLATGQSGQCFTLEASPSGGSSISPGDLTGNKTGDAGHDDWTVSYNGPANTIVTYTAFYQPNCDPPTFNQDNAVGDTAQVDWVLPTTEQNHTVTATPSVVIADGHSASTVTVVLTDYQGNAITGESVTLTGVDPSATVTPPTATSGAGGQAVFTVTSATPASMTIGAQHASYPSPIPATTTLEFVAASQAERALSSVGASLSRVAADGLSTTTVTATLKDTTGPLAGRSVRLAPQVTGNAMITPLGSQTNTTGQISFTVSDPARESVNLVATDTTSNLVVGTVPLRFGDPPAGEQGKGTSQMSLSPSGDVVSAATLPNDGTTAAAVYVQLLCDDLPADGCTNSGWNMYAPPFTQSGTVRGARVALVPTSATSAVVTQVLNPTNANGEARFLVTDTVPEDVTFNAVDVTNNLTVASVDDSTSPALVTPLKVTLSFVGPGTPSGTTSSATASPTSVAADGASTSTITVTLRDANRIPVPNRTVTVTPSSGTATVSPSQAITDGNGVATFSTADPRAETVSYTVMDVAANIALTTFPQVTFTAGAPSPAASTIAASPSTVPADGSSTSTITVTITDASGGPLSGKTVSLNAASGSSTITGPSGKTNASGATTFAVKDAKPESVTYTATDVTDGFDLTHTATVTFTGNPSTQNSTISADPLSVPAGSIATSTVVVTLEDQNGNPVAGKQVQLMPAGQAHSSPVTPGSDTSNQSGTASFSVTDGSAETVTLQAKDVTDTLVLPATVTVTFTGAPSGAVSTVTANPTGVPADGTSTSTIAVTVLDGNAQPIPGQNVTLAGTSGTHSKITAVSNPTDASGRSTFTVTDGTAETVTYSATDTSVSPNQKIFATAQVVFGPLPAVSSISPTYGPAAGGTKVTISGTNLSTAKAVQFGPTLITNISKKNGTVTVTSPPGTGTVHVQVVTSSATTPPVAADQFRYGPQVTQVSPASGPAAGGTKVTISGNNFTNLKGVNFGGAPATSVQLNKNGTITAVSPPGTAGVSVDVEVVTNGGPSDHTASDKFTYT